MQKNKYQVKDRIVAKVMRLYRRLPFGVPHDDIIILNLLKFYYWSKKNYFNIIRRETAIDVEEKLNKLNLFFGFAVIRSGTHFLANFLNSQLDDTIVTHEATVTDYLSYSKTYQSKLSSINYFKDFRKKDIFYRLINQEINDYGEINPFLRRHVDAIKQEFPKCKIFHLIRDGKKVVRSIMCRGTFTNKDPLKDIVKPDSKSFYYEKWNKMSRFEKVCWLWLEDNKYLRDRVGYTLKFEKLITDYDYFRDKLLDYLNIYISQNKWEEYVNRPKNKSQIYTFPEWEQWTKEQKNQFINICGKEMSINGYKI